MKTLKRERKFIFLAVLALSLFGLLIIYSASCIYAYQLHADAAYFLKRQSVFLLCALVSFFVMLLADINFLKKHNKEFLLGTVILLVLVLVAGKSAGGARRWFSLGFFSFQPSELLKIFFLIYCAAYFSRKGISVRYFQEGMLPVLLVAGLIAFLLLLEPDLGTVVFWVVWMFLMFFIVRARKKHLWLLIGSGVGMFALLVKTHPYRVQRLLSYLNPWSDPQGAGFQLIQSQIAFGEGGLLGAGLGGGKQKLLFLPAAHTDFIFSIVAEEFGFIGSLTVLGCYCALIITMLHIATKLRDDFSRYVCIGIALIVGLEAVINIGVACGFFPTKGLPLPFMSYGGTSLLIHYILLGLFFNVTRLHEHTLGL